MWNFLSSYFNYFIYILFVLWGIVSIYAFFKQWRAKNNNNVVFYYDLIPSIFTTLGILGTFGGIFLGLQKFNVYDISNSIPLLLEGLKTAFSTSLLGIFLSLLAGIISKYIAKKIENQSDNPLHDDELSALNQIISILSEIHHQNRELSNNLLNSLTEDNNSLLKQMEKLEKQNNEHIKLFQNQILNFEVIQKLLQEIKEQNPIEYLKPIQKLLQEIKEQNPIEYLEPIQELLQEIKEQHGIHHERLHLVLGGNPESNIFDELTQVKTQVVLIGEKHEENKQLLQKVNESIAIVDGSIHGGFEIIQGSLNEHSNQNNLNFRMLKDALVGNSNESLQYQLLNLQNVLQSFGLRYQEMIEVLNGIIFSISGDAESSVVAQINSLRIEQNVYANNHRESMEMVVDTMTKNHRNIVLKFDELSEIIIRNNTEALVEVMKKATEEFNAQMSALISRLVQENFQELNKSVERMNQWQQENKEMIQSLTNQFIKVSDSFAITAQLMDEITENTHQLTNDNSHLVLLIKELQKVMIEDTKYQQIVDKLTYSIDTLKENTKAFDETSNKLNQWFKNQMNFTDAVAKLLTKLEEIEKIKDINEVFWQNTKKQLNEGISLIEAANRKLAEDLDKINAEFYNRLNTTFQNLDELIQSVILKYISNDKRL